MRACLPLLILLGCPAGPSTDPLPDAVELGGECAAAEHFGRFVVQAQAEYTIVQGQVWDGVVPASIPSEAAREGGCRLLLRQTPFCDPACDSASTCNNNMIAQSGFWNINSLNRFMFKNVLS